MQRQGAGTYGVLATILLSTYFLSDLSALLLENFIPEPPVSRSFRTGGFDQRTKSQEEYQAIVGRNLFSSKNLIPGEEGQPEDQGGAPIKSSLPLNLIGTVILRDELKSIATIEDKSASVVFPVRMDDEIPGKAKILKVEPTKVIFVNTSSGRREFIELPEDLQTSNARISLGTPVVKRGGGGSGVEKVSPNQFNIAKSEVDRVMADFNQVLTQARAVPNIENGVTTGFNLFQIVPGSIYDKLGLQNGDTITGLNGEPLNDVGKAMNLLTELRSANHLELTIKRNGKPMNYTYDIR